jgi:hypothetical protein
LLRTPTLSSVKKLIHSIEPGATLKIFVRVKFDLRVKQQDGSNRWIGMNIRHGEEPALAEAIPDCHMSNEQHEVNLKNIQSCARQVEGRLHGGGSC